jgi:aminomethyltransferase
MNTLAAARTPLHDLHGRLGAKFVTFAGYDMPVQYPAGVLAEHLHTRTHASLFDVSHMGQLRLSGPNIIAAIEALVPGDIAGLAPGQMRYTQFTNEAGGILDDLMVTRGADHLDLVVNAGTKHADLAHLANRLPKGITIDHLEDRALLALQGPDAAVVIARQAPALATMPFMTAAPATLWGIDCNITRSGYTGEDGFEISAPASRVVELGQALLGEAEVRPAGLGARDSLRLEAGLCLYGHDIDTTTTPVEAGLSWSIGKRRRAEGGFPGAAIILRQIAEGPSRRRVGILPEGRAPAREHTEIHHNGQAIGSVSSGGYGPSVGGPIAIGYIASHAAAAGTPLELIVRDTPRPARVVPLPFVPTRYFRV